MGVGLAVVTLFITLMQVVLCKDWNLMLPQSITAISGSCVTIPCHFEVPDNYESDIHNCSRGGVWKKGVVTNPPVFSASNAYNNIIQGQTLGDETKKNCTTVFYTIPKNYSDIYFFRLECPNRIKFTFLNGVYIIIQPGPSPPKMTSMIQMLEGIQMMRLQCSVPVPCPALPPSLTWLPRDDSRQQQTQILQNQDGQMTMVSTLTFIASADLHNQSVICSVSYPLAKGGSTEPSATTQRLNIQYAPRFTEATLSVSGPVSEGHTVTFTCFSDANPPARNYTWYRDDSGMLTIMGDRGTLVLQVTKRDSGLYMCEAENQRGSQRSRLVSLEVVTAAESSKCFMVFHYVICGIVVLLYILTVVVDVYKYQSLSRRLKQIELKGEHTYMDLRNLSVTSDYEQLQPQQPKTQPRPQVQNNERTVAPQAIRKNKPQPKRT